MCSKRDICLCIVILPYAALAGWFLFITLTLFRFFFVCSAFVYHPLLSIWLFWNRPLAMPFYLMSLTAILLNLVTSDHSSLQIIYKSLFHLSPSFEIQSQISNCLVDIYHMTSPVLQINLVRTEFTPVIMNYFFQLFYFYIQLHHPPI